MKQDSAPTVIIHDISKAVVRPPKAELDVRFRKVYLEIINEQKVADIGRLVVPSYIANNAISEQQKSSARVPSGEKSGLPMMLFNKNDNPILLSTAGIYYKSYKGKRDGYSWQELSGVTPTNLEYGQTVITAHQDEERLKLAKLPHRNRVALKLLSGVSYYVFALIRASHLSQHMLHVGMVVRFFLEIERGLVLLGGLVFCPIIYVILYKVYKQWYLAKYIRQYPSYKNILKFGTNNFVDCGFERNTIGIVDCALIAIELYREQMMKYGM